MKTVNVMLGGITVLMLLAANKRVPIKTNSNTWDFLIKHTKQDVQRLAVFGSDQQPTNVKG